MRTTALTLLTTATTVLALAAPASAAHGALTVTGLTANDRLVTFAASDPGTILSTVKITGLAEDDDVAAIDFRASTGGLYAVVTSRSEGARLFLVDPATGAATRVGTSTLPVSGAVTAVDGRLSYATGEQPGIGDVAYTNNDTDPTTGTMLYDVDAALDQLALQNPPNAGTLTRVGPLGQPTKAQATGFDVYTRTSGTRTSWAFVSLFDKGRTTFYEIDLATGQPITVTAPVPGSGTQIATRPHVTDIALAPAQAGF